MSLSLDQLDLSLSSSQNKPNLAVLKNSSVDIYPITGWSRRSLPFKSSAILSAMENIAASADLLNMLNLRHCTVHKNTVLGTSKRDPHC